MKKSTAVIMITTPPRWWGNLKKFCRDNQLSYSTYSKKKFPFEVNGISVYKVEKL